MNCDLVFEILTRGPFPAGQATDATVELHLRSCYECRQLAEALRPATSLFHEALDDDSGSLPGYHGDLPVMAARPSAVAAAVEAAIQEIAQETDAEARQPPVELLARRKGAWQKRPYASLPFSLAMLAAAMLAATMAGMYMGRSVSQRALETVASAKPPAAADLESTMAALPATCRKPAAPELLAAAGSRSAWSVLSQCCHCHIEPAGAASSVALADQAVSMCVACHTH